MLSCRGSLWGAKAETEDVGKSIVEIPGLSTIPTDWNDFNITLVHFHLAIQIPYLWHKTWRFASFGCCSFFGTVPFQSGTLRCTICGTFPPLGSDSGIHLWSIVDRTDQRTVVGLGTGLQMAQPIAIHQINLLHCCDLLHSYD